MSELQRLRARLRKAHLRIRELVENSWKANGAWVCPICETFCGGGITYCTGYGDHGEHGLIWAPAIALYQKHHPELGDPFNPPEITHFINGVPIGGMENTLKEMIAGMESMGDDPYITQLRTDLSRTLENYQKRYDLDFE